MVLRSEDGLLKGGLRGPLTSRNRVWAPRTWYSVEGGGGEGFCMTVWASKEESFLGIDFSFQQARNRTHTEDSAWFMAPCVLTGTSCARTAGQKIRCDRGFPAVPGPVWACAGPESLGVAARCVASAGCSGSGRGFFIHL